MFNLQDVMAGSQLDSLLALLGRTLVDESEKLDIAEKLHSNGVSVPTLLLSSDSELDGLIHALFPAASLGAKLGFKTAIRFQKESVASPGFEDRSEYWIKHMMLPRQPALPRNVDDLKNILLPEDHGKLPVNLDGYHKFRSEMRLQTGVMIEVDRTNLRTPWGSTAVRCQVIVFRGLLKTGRNLIRSLQRLDAPSL